MSKSPAKPPNAPTMSADIHGAWVLVLVAAIVGGSIGIEAIVRHLR